MPNIVKSTSTRLEELYKKDSRLVKGLFICHEPKGGEVTFSVRKYKQQPTTQYTMKDGQEYEVPLFVAQHINSCGWEVHAHLLDAAGNPMVGVGKKERRFTFQSIDFM